MLCACKSHAFMNASSREALIFFHLFFSLPLLSCLSQLEITVQTLRTQLKSAKSQLEHAAELSRREHEVQKEAAEQDREEQQQQQQRRQQYQRKKQDLDVSFVEPEMDYPVLNQQQQQQQNKKSYPGLFTCVCL